jgi:isoleucyl-tRNA synthetase
MADRWILSKVNNLVTDVTRNMEAFDLGIALDKVQNFIWEEFCDWYIEMVKPRLWDEKDETKGAALWTLKQVLITSLKLLHPFCPFITEEIYDTLTDSSSPLMRQDWPSYDKALDFSEDEAEIEAIKEAVRAIRNIRTEMNVAPSRKAQNYVVTTNDRARKTFEHSKVFFATLAYASEVFIQEDKNGISDDAVSVAIPDAVIYIPFADLVDIEKEKERLSEMEDRIEQTKLQYEPAIDAKTKYEEIDSLGKKNITGKVVLSGEDYEELTSLAKEGLTSRTRLWDMQRTVEYYRDGFERYSTRYENLSKKYEELNEKTKPFLDAMEHFPELVTAFVNKLKDLFRDKAAREQAEREKLIAEREKQRAARKLTKKGRDMER